MTDLTPRQVSSRFGHLKREHRKRYKIVIQYKGGCMANGKYPIGVWPILFKSRKDAYTAVKVLPIFLNNGASRSSRSKGFRRIKSACIESVYIPVRSEQ